MINLTKEIIILLEGPHLTLAVSQALKKVETTFKTSNKNLRTAIKKIQAELKLHAAGNSAKVVSEWYYYLIFKYGDNHHTQKYRRTHYLSTLTNTDATQIRIVLRFLFVKLHKDRAALLTYEFTRPLGSITALPEEQKTYYCETIYPFLALETKSFHLAGSGKRPYTMEQRLWQTAIKVILMSSFFSPEDVNLDDIKALHTAQFPSKRNGLIPMPIVKILEAVCLSFKDRVSKELQQWAAEGIATTSNDSNSYNNEEDSLLRNLNQIEHPLKFIKSVLSNRKFGAISFSCQSIRHYHLDTHIFRNSKQIEKAFLVWMRAEQSFFDYQCFEKPRHAQLAIGKINIYLFVYLPLWLQQNQKSKFKYPYSPETFTGSVHFDCTAPLTEDRPLSVCELFRELGYVENNGGQTNIRTFFDYLIKFGSDIEGCHGVRQPVHKVPVSKNYANVKKNVFTGKQLQLFIAYHYALDSAADYYFTNSSSVKAIFDKAIKKKTHVDTQNLGYVPIIYHDGKITYITRIHPNTFSFVLHNYDHYYNPGCVRFSLFLLECGVRGQTLQWLGADSYDRTSHRLSRDSLQLTTLWLNTDKVHKIPIIIVTSMSNLWLLDDQREWRRFMIDHVGVKGFNREVFYDHDPKSHWGKILPLFASNPVTGTPFSDRQYTRHWNYHCLNFQVWCKDNTPDNVPIVGLLPKKNTTQGSYFEWEDWLNKIDPNDVLTLPGNPSNKVYCGEYCPIALRAYSTPHGARASFITDVSINLPPEAVVLLTGQSVSSITKYNKGHHLLHDRLKGAFNNRDADWYLTYQFDAGFSMSDARDRIEDSQKQGRLPKTIEDLGLKSFPTSPSPREMTGLKLIATDRSMSLGATYTHICPFNFICPDQIIKKFKGVKKCSQCPFAVFSTHNIAAIEAQRQRLAEEYKNTWDVIERYSCNRDVPIAERSRLQAELESAASEVISWMLVEEMLWGHIEMKQDENTKPGKDFFATNSNAVRDQISRFEFRRDSAEGFLTRLDSACVYPDSLSQHFAYKIDRGTRLLMIRDGNIMETAMMSSNFPSAVRLAGLIRSHLQTYDLDLDSFVELINLPEKDWEHKLLSHHHNPPPKL